MCWVIDPVHPLLSTILHRALHPFKFTTQNMKLHNTM